jgi:hypothetical protein
VAAAVWGATAEGKESSVLVVEAASGQAQTAAMVPVSMAWQVSSRMALPAEMEIRPAALGRAPTVGVAAVLS